MYAQLRLRVWIVDPGIAPAAGTYDLLNGDAELIDEAELRRRIDAGGRPDALLIDAGTLDRLDGQRMALDGVVRTLIVADGPAHDLPSAVLDRSSVRIMHRPVDDDDFEQALQWLSGGDVAQTP